MKYLIEKRNFYNVGDTILIEYWYNNMIVPVIIKEHIKNKYKVSHNIPQSKIQNAPDEFIKSADIIDIFRD